MKSDDTRLQPTVRKWRLQGLRVHLAHTHVQEILTAMGFTDAQTLVEDGREREMPGFSKLREEMRRLLCRQM